MNKRPLFVGLTASIVAIASAVGCDNQVIQDDDDTTSSTGSNTTSASTGGGTCDGFADSPASGPTIVRFRNVLLQDWFFKRARKKPSEVADLLKERLRECLDDKFQPADFAPPYGPWRQRLCFVPDGDFFEAIRAGTAQVVTGRIASVDRAVGQSDGWLDRLIRRCPRPQVQPR